MNKVYRSKHLRSVFIQNRLALVVLLVYLDLLFDYWIRSSIPRLDEVKFGRSRFPCTAYVLSLMSESVGLMCIVGLLHKEFLSQTKVVWSLGSKRAIPEGLNHHLLLRNVVT